MGNNSKNNKVVTLDDLAIMVAKGFDNLGGVMDNLGGRMDKLDGRMDKLENEMVALRSSVNNYLKLSDSRYLELKHRQNVIVSWVKQIADKTGVQIDFKELENKV